MEKDEDIEIEQNNIPIASCCKQYLDMTVNQSCNEIALITDTYEITFFSLATGKPSRSIDLEQIARQMSEEVKEDVQ